MYWLNCSGIKPDLAEAEALLLRLQAQVDETIES